MPKSRKKGEPSQADSLGNLVLDSIRKVIDRTVQVGKRLPLPGEGDERPFRDWLKSQLLVAVLGWPDERVKIGERFDILLLDEFDRPVVTIETKAPYHHSSKEEQKTFRERLSFYATLRAAYFTNGPEWDRVDLVSLEGQQTIHERVSLEISQATSEHAESFFAPLKGDRYSEWGKRNRSLVAKAQPHILEGLARDLDSIVLDLTEFLSDLFANYEQRNAGTTIRDLTRSIFDDWCSRSLQVAPQQVLNAIVPLLQNTEIRRETLASELRGLGFIPTHSSSAADRLLVLRPEERLESEHVRRAIMPLYHDQIKKLSAQSAHVLLARILVYRIGEDMDLFDAILGGEALLAALTKGRDSIAAEPTPALSILESVRRRMLNILPVVYQLSDLDWWRVPEEKRAGMEPGDRAFVERKEQELDQLVTRSLRIMDSYHFAQVDADVWRNVYQNYLPEEERQRIGGFYTPQELVEFILDQAGYVSEAEGLCHKKVIDPACGSGAFATAAAARLLKHMEMPLPCHHEESGKLIPKWEKQRVILQTVLERIHAVDTHPFAAFLTTLNLTFLMLPLYANVRKHNLTFPLDFRVFAADSLDKPDKESLAPDMFEQLNSRIQLTKASYDRFRAFIDTRFDLICGNPPWGGVLKGPLAPVFEERKKQRFKREFPNAATGKYDIYGLFMERAVQLLTDGGRLAMVTQDTYLDKEWAKGLRKYLATNTTVQEIVDLNPFGQLLFGRMNTPAVTIFDNAAPDKGSFIAVTTSSRNLKEITPGNRRRYVLETVASCLAALTGQRRRVTIDFATATRLPHQMLIDNAPKRWSLVSKDGFPEFKTGWFSIVDILEPRQGVTPGGCLDVFLMSERQALELKLEPELVHRAIKTKETERWHVNWEGRVLLYPYTVENDEAIPAFAIKNKLLNDSLDFENTVDDYERELRRGRILDNNTAKDILEHRIALGLVKYPQTARYLVQSYSRLEGRVFEKRLFSQLGKRWYEYHRARDPNLMLGTNRIISPSLAKEARFALDAEGFLADHACQYLFPTASTSKRREELRQKLSDVLGREVDDMAVLCYCLAFMNSPYAQETLVSGRRPTPKGSYQISEEYLKEIPVALPSTKEQAEEISSIVKELVSGTSGGQKAVLETRLSKLVMTLLAAEQ
jgi:hypothetical protein